MFRQADQVQDPGRAGFPWMRALGVGAAGSAAWQAHLHLLRTRPNYAESLYRAALKFEDLTPFHMGRTARLSERFSSYLIPEVGFSYEQLVAQGGLTRLGEHLHRLMGGRVDLFGRGEGLTFRRSSLSDPYLALAGRPDVRVRFARAGRLTGTSYRYGADLKPRRLELDFDGPWWHAGRLKANFQRLKESQLPRGYQEGASLADDFLVQPYAAKLGEPLADDFRNVTRWLPDALRSLRKHIGLTALELMERPQGLLADVGVGVRAGTYNKVFHVPFVGEGGILNETLLKRVAPAVLGFTAAGYLDYITGHRVSNALVGLPLKANTLRADITDMVPGARAVTDFYEQVTPGPQYGPVALPLAGAFAGGLYHYAHVLRGTKYADELARKAGAKILPRAETLTRELLTVKGAKQFWQGLGYPGRGALVGLAMMLPFLPGMIGSRRTGAELRDIYSGKEPVPIRAGRWWDMGSTPYQGARIKEYRPHWYQLFRSRAEIKSVYGSEEEYWAHNPILHPFRFLRDPYWLERRNYAARPYPVASPAFSNTPLIGPLLAATVGKLVKPPVRMHEREWAGDDYTLYSTRLEPRGGMGLPPPKPQAEFGLRAALWQEGYQEFPEWVGLPGFIAQSVYNALFPNHDLGRDVYLQGSRQMTSASRRYYEHELGAVAGPTPAETAYFGYSEPFRRFVQRDLGIAQANEIPNQMPEWLPGDDYFIDFRVGDPYVRIAEGYARLPGAGYEALHPNVAGVDPADYPDIEKLRILGDVAPYSKEFATVRGRVAHQAGQNTELEIEYEKILDRVKKLKESVIRMEDRRFTGETDQIRGHVSGAGLGGIELEEYPGRVFQLSSLGYSAADLSAAALGEDNSLSRSQVVGEVERRQQRLQEFFGERFEPGRELRLTVPAHAADNLETIRAVVEAGGENVNQALISEGLAVYRKDAGGPEAAAMHGFLGQQFGAAAEALSFQGDQSFFNPLRYIPSPAHTKLWQMRTPLAQYEAEEVVGTRMRRWHRPLHDFLAPYGRGLIKRLTGQDIVPEGVQFRRNLNTLVDTLDYLRALQMQAAGLLRGRYTSQASRTSVGANLFGSPTFIASTLPDREAAYFKRFLAEADPDQRQEILAVAPPEMARALQAQWAAQAARLGAAEGTAVPPLGEEGRLLTQAGVSEYQQASTRLGYGDYMRSKDVAEFFYHSGFSLPSTDSSIWDDVVDYEDVKLKIIQQEGYDMHDFNVFEDRAALLWRKPWLDGMVRELTSGERRSVDNLRYSVEQLMLATRDRNPDVRAVGQASHRASGNVRVDVEVDDDQELLQDIRRNPERYDIQQS